MKGRKLAIIIIIFFISLGFAPLARAATASLYFSPSSGEYALDKTFSVEIKVNTGGAAINAAQGTITFSNNNLQVTDISKSGSIFSLWPDEPDYSNSNGTVIFAGGAPSPGYSGASGKLITITFKALSAGSAAVSFISGAVLANDGKGTNVLSSMGSGSYNISVGAVAPKAKTKPAVKEESKKTVVTLLTQPVISSPTHPDQNSWYNSNDLRLNWELPYGVDGVSLLLDQKEISNPGPTSDGLFSFKEYKGLEDGIWYFHLKFKRGNGWSEIAHFKIQIDTIAPDQFNVDVSREEGKSLPMLFFRTFDNVSGIAKYEIKIDGQSHEVSGQENTFAVPSLKAGNYTAIVKALDRAGNETIAIKDFSIEIIEPPKITSYPKELGLGERLVISGTAGPNLLIKLYLENKYGKIFELSTPSDPQGNWMIFYQGKIVSGQYMIWAKAVDASGRQSEPSEKLELRVPPSFISSISYWILKYFSIFIGLIILLFVFGILIFYLFLLILAKFKKAKREADEIEQVLDYNFEELRRHLEKELSVLDKAKNENEYRKQRIKIRLSFKDKIKEIKKKIAKEIKDVKILLTVEPELERIKEIKKKFLNRKNKK